MAEEQLSRGNDDGTNLGQSTTDKIGFHGITAITCASIAALVTTALSSGGVISVKQAADLITLVNDLRLKLIDKGLVTA